MNAISFPLPVPNQCWQITAPAGESLSLRWRIDGRGDPQSGEVACLTVPPNGVVDIPIPADAPAAYTGLLFEVSWEVELLGEVWRCGPPSPYAALGLSRNPFCTEQVPPRQEEWTGVEQQLWLERGHSQPPRPSGRQLVQLLGDKGAGKSSHLAQWRRQSSGPARYYPPDYLGRWRWPPLAPICYWDEACRIPAPLLWLALGGAALAGHTVCVGTHRDLGQAARIFGLNVQTIALPPITPAELREWAARRVAAVALPEAALGLSLPDSLVTECLYEFPYSWRDLSTKLHIWAAQSAVQCAGEVTRDHF